MPGDHLGKYEIVRELAIGGMAAIYLARVHGTAGFEKTVVLKCILPNLARDRGLVSMFLDEARIAATLRHSNIADVFDVGADGHRYYIAMEYVQGETARTIRLAAAKRGQSIPFEVALATILGTTAALAYAHDKQGPDGPLDLIHRDVSPSNIIVGVEGAVKLVDFGIARASVRNTRTRTGLRRGKVPYMSPEQCQGKALDRRTDLFSLGTVLYELTTMQRPFRGNSDFEVMDAIVACDPPPPSSIVRDYPPALEHMVMRLLSRSPDARYQNAHQLIDDLEMFAAQQGIMPSAHVVTRYMRELFEREAPELDIDTALSGPSAARTREYPDGKPRAQRAGTRARAQEPAVRVPTAEQQMWASELVAKRVPRATTKTDPSMSPWHERTSQDLILPYDVIDAYGAEILSTLDQDARPGESPSARAFRRVETLLQQADGWLAMGDAERAVAAIELTLDEDMSSERVQGLMQWHVNLIVKVYEAVLEDPYRVPVLTRPQHEIAEMEMEARARILLPWIDGKTTIKQIIERSGMQRLEAYHHLCQLLMRGMLA